MNSVGGRFRTGGDSVLHASILVGADVAVLSGTRQGSNLQPYDPKSYGGRRTWTSINPVHASSVLSLTVYLLEGGVFEWGRVLSPV
jgi:hypothetical protein